MKQKKIINAIIIIASSALLIILWFIGFNGIYARILTWGTNLFLLPWPDSNISVELQNGNPIFIVQTYFEDKGVGTYPQEAKLLILPVIMVWTWQILMFFNLSLKKALRSFAENFGIFYLAQVLFLLLLINYYQSNTAKYIYELLMDSFYIIALFLIVKDALKYRLIKIAGK